MKKLFAVILAMAALLPWAPASAEEMPATAPLFALSLPMPNDKQLAFETLKGKPLVINFWARWCGPCRKEIPDFAEMNTKYQGKGLVIVGIAVEDAGSRDSVREFAKAYEMNYALVIAGVQTGVELMKTLGNPKSGLPFTLIIDRNGKIVSKKLGAMTKAEMEATIKQIL